MSRSHFFLALVFLAAASVPVLADEPSGDRALTNNGSDSSAAPSYGGKLICNDADNDGTAPYKLLDKWGIVQTYVRPQPGLDLQPFVGRHVWIESAGTTVRYDGTKSIRANAVTLGDRPGGAPLRWLPYGQAGVQSNQGNSAPRAIRQTEYQEPAAKPQGEPIPAPQPVPSSTRASGARTAVPEPSAMPADGQYAADDGPAMFMGPGPDGPGIDGDGCADGCGPCRGGPCSRCCLPLPRNWVDLDVLLWWAKGMETPPLVTTGPSASQPGYLGSPGTVILCGAGTVLDDMQVGGRLRVGRWLNDCDTVGVEGEFMALSGDSYNFNAWSGGTPILSRPFFDVAPGANFENVEDVAVPGVIAGSVNVDARTWFLGAGVDLRYYLGGSENCWSSCDGCTSSRSGWRADLLLGYRYLELRDHLGVTEELTSIGGVNETVANENPSSSFLVQDEFDTKDQFQGGQIGMSLAANRNRWWLQVTPKIAFGTTFETANINGNTITTDAFGRNTYAQGGLLAQSTNIGPHSDQKFAVVPELGLTLGYQLTSRLEATFGYSFLYWSTVARAGDQIDFNVNSNVLPGGPGGAPNRPLFVFQQTSYWVQGINFGLGYRW